MFEGLFEPAKAKVLRPYQTTAIDRLRSSLGKGKRRPVLQLPTGAGKTLIAASIIRGARDKGKRVIFFVPALSLVGQTVDAFRAEGIRDIGVLQGQHLMTDLSQPVQVATVQTFGQRERRPEFDFAIVDECHIRSKAIEDLMAEHPARIFVGLSATPWTRGLGLVYDDLVIGTTLQELIAGGLLSTFRAYAPAHPDLTGVKTVAGDFHQGQLGEAMGKERLVADVVSTWLERGENRPTLCFAVDRAHAAKLQMDFERAGVRAGYVDAFTDAVERDVIRRRFEAGDLKVVCNCRTLTTGVDWAVGCIIDAAPTKSEMLHVQRIGRGLRVNEGIPDCIVLDHADNSLRLGLVTDIQHDALDTSKPGDPKPKAKPIALPKECPKCAFVKAPKVHECPRCGFQPEMRSKIETDDGELVEITGKQPRYTKAEKQAWWSAILSIQAQRGRSKGWASHTYRDKFGVWPAGVDDKPGPVPVAVSNFIRAKDIRFAKSRERKAS